MLTAMLPDLDQLDGDSLRALLIAEHQQRLTTEEQLRSRENEISD